MDVIFHVKLRKMMDVGGSQEEDLVASVKVTSSSLAEGTWTCTNANEAGQVVVCWDNNYSLFRSKTIAYRTWVVKGDAATQAPLSDAPAAEGVSTGEQEAAAKAAAEAAAVTRREETARAAEQEAAAAKAASDKAVSDKATADKATVELLKSRLCSLVMQQI